MAESSGKPADHNLDLSLGNSGSNKHSNGQALGNHAPNTANDQHLPPPESQWRNGGNKAKVSMIQLNILLFAD